MVFRNVKLEVSNAAVATPFGTMSNFEKNDYSSLIPCYAFFLRLIEAMNSSKVRS